jgi:hypothetical protein
VNRVSHGFTEIRASVFGAEYQVDDDNAQ